jgi:hypothetical protein
MPEELPKRVKPYISDLVNPASLACSTSHARILTGQPSVSDENGAAEPSNEIDHIHERDRGMLATKRHKKEIGTAEGANHGIHQIYEKERGVRGIIGRAAAARSASRGCPEVGFVALRQTRPRSAGVLVRPGILGSGEIYNEITERHERSGVG